MEKNRVRIMEVTVKGQIAFNIDMFEDEGRTYTDVDMLEDKDLVAFLGEFDKIISIDKKILGVQDAKEYLTE